MRVLFVTAELTPLAKVGGLADVAGALPPAIAALGQEIQVVMPWYEQIDTKQFPIAETPIAYTVPFAGKEERVRVGRTTIPGSAVPLLLLENPEHLSRGDIYAGNALTELQRFLFFSNAVVALLLHLPDRPDVVHCQDWHTGVIPALIKEQKDRPASVFTIHNLGYQGKIAPKDAFALLNITSPDGTWGRTSTGGDFNFIQQAIWNADQINTVSARYSQEIRTKEYGAGLENDLQENADRVSGILNGIDTDRFDPEQDTAITQRYTSETLADAKQVNRASLRTKIGLPDAPDAPLITLVTRLAEQKGMDLVLDALDAVVREGAQVAILGTGEKRIEHALAAAAKKHPQHLSVTLAFDATLAKQFYAGGDLFCMPSQYEPCGLGQMIAMRYGTPPVVRKTGGLADTVPDADEDPSAGTGFSFSAYTGDALAAALVRGIHAVRETERWLTIARRGMQKDFSWKTSAHDYGTLYENAQKRPRP